MMVAIISLAGLVPARTGTQWQLPISLDQTKVEVEGVLGPPNASVPRDLRSIDREAADYFSRRQPRQSIDWYYSSGLVGRYTDGRLFAITVNPHVSFPGWIDHGGPIVSDVLLTDTKATVLRKLGPPSKIENDPLDSNADVEVPVVWPAQSRYSWRLPTYTVEITFLRQTQSISSEQRSVAKKDEIAVIMLFK